MIYRNFNKLKFKRTFIGGSKKNEKKIFEIVQGTKEDNSDCNWIEYRKIFIQYFDDILNIFLTWIYLIKILYIVFITLTFLTSFINLNIFICFLLFSICLKLGLKHLKIEERKKLSAYNFALDIILLEIKRKTGFQFEKN